MVQSKVVVGYEGRVPVDEAVRQLGCSYSHVINLIKKKKIKAQKAGKSWMIDHEDLKRAVATGLVKPRPRKPEGSQMNNASSSTNTGDSTELRITIPREKFELVRLAFKNSDKTLVGYLTAKVDEVYEQIQQKIKDLTL